jgi:hypothetical protein
MSPVFGGFLGMGGQEMCILLFAIPIYLLIWAALLMGACALFNKIAGASAAGQEAPPPYPYDEERPAGSPGSPGIQERPGQGYGGIQERPGTGLGDDYPEPDRDLGIRRTAGVPQPDLLKAMGIALAVLLLGICVGSLLGLVFGGAAAGLGPRGRADVLVTGLVGNLLSIIAGFFIEAGLLTSMLPTTFGKAALVTLIHYLIGFAIVVVLVACLFGIGIGLGLRG